MPLAVGDKLATGVPAAWLSVSSSMELCFPSLPPLDPPEAGSGGGPSGIPVGSKRAESKLPSEESS
eukprot:CAMPEP_0171778388 /NCGR_PEP_ID=MMETSP0991-20121206/58373_1 /TAXON_ID=483369 /ORGANISM="non described non described, Strain CCMP2098" /LENGTH=65 /DNA_ID=CAMNT_0012385335 /DNA_START=250 /DNA_END=444 /DNA_ORIENTATION=+